MRNEAWRSGLGAALQSSVVLLGHDHYSLFAAACYMLGHAAQGKFDYRAKLRFSVLKPPSRRARMYLHGFN